MKHLKAFKEEIDLSKYDEVEPGKFTPKVTRYQDKKYSFTKEQLYDFVCNFVGASGFSIEDIENGLDNFDFNDSSIHNEGKAEKAAKNPYGSTGKEDKKDQLRKAVEDHIKTKDCKSKKVGDDFEIHCDGEHIGQVMFRDEKITVKKKGEKFGKEFKYNELGKIKAEVTSVIKDCCK